MNCHCVGGSAPSSYAPVRVAIVAQRRSETNLRLASAHCRGIEWLCLTPTEAQTGVALVRKVRDAGITVLMVEHVMEVVMPLVDRAIVLDLGKVLVEGKPTEVVRDPKVISAYLGDRHAVGA